MTLWNFSYKISTKVPIVMSVPPIIALRVTTSFNTTNARTMVITTLNLSMGTTFDASPIYNALK